MRKIILFICLIIFILFCIWWGFQKNFFSFPTIFSSRQESGSFEENYKLLLAQYSNSSKDKTAIIRVGELIDSESFFTHPYFGETKNLYEYEGAFGNKNNSQGIQNTNSPGDISSKLFATTGKIQIPGLKNSLSQNTLVGNLESQGLNNTNLPDLSGKEYGTNVQIEPCLIFDYQAENGAPVCFSENKFLEILQKGAQMF